MTRLAGQPESPQRDVVEPTVDEHGYESHPSWGLIGVHRGSVGGVGGGAELFDSDIHHRHTVTVRLHTARRQRDLHRDWIGADREVVEVEMSEAQWASFVSSMNVGEGVPCTIRRRNLERVPEAPFRPRLQESIREVREDADELIAEVAAAFDAYKAHKTVANLRTLEARIRNLPANAEFAAKSLTEHAENVVQRARADIEAMVVAKAQQLGLDPADVGAIGQLTTGEDEVGP